MALQPETIAQWFGFSVRGDFGPYTWYTRTDRKMVAFLRNQLDGKELTPARLAMRNKFRAAASEWQQLTSAERAEWNLTAKRLSIVSTGYNLWVHWSLLQDDDAIRTIERQARTNLLPPSTRP